MASFPDSRLSDISQRWPDIISEFESSASGYATMTGYFEYHQQSSAPYYSWMASALRPYLGRRTMELGAGPGILSEHLSDFDLYLATETWEPFFGELQKLARNRRNMAVLKMDARDLIARRDEIREYHLDSIFSTNMLEHIKDDIAVLRHMAAVVGAAGRVVNLVPAFRLLYSEIDQSIGHYRRYEKEELGVKMEAAGLRVEKLFYFNQPGYIAWLVANRILGSRKTTTGQFKLFNFLVPLFRTTDKLLPTFVGSSLIGVGQLQ